MKKIYLDDIRNPKAKDWIVVRSYNDFVSWIQNNGVPDEISFDHDLGQETKTGYDAAKWLCAYCMDNCLPLPSWNIHSANPVGADNIKNYLLNFDKHFAP